MMPYPPQLSEAVQGDRRTFPSQFAAVRRTRVGHDTDYDRTPNEASSVVIQPEAKL